MYWQNSNDAMPEKAKNKDIRRIQPKVILTKLTESEINIFKRGREDEISVSVACKVPKLKVMEKPSSPINESSTTIIAAQQNEIFALNESVVKLKTELEKLKRMHMNQVKSLSESMLDANEKRFIKIVLEKNLLIEKLKEAEEEREGFVNQIETVHSIKKDEIRKLEDERCEAMDNMSRIHSSEMQALKKFYESKSAKDYDSYIDEIGQLKETIEQLNSTLADKDKILLDQNEKSNECQRKILNSHIEDNERLQKRILDIEKKCRDDAETYDQGIELLIKSRDKLKQQREADRVHWKKATEAALKKMELTHFERMNEIQTEHSEKIRKLEDKLNDERDDYDEMKNELAQKSAEIISLEENIAKHKLELAASIETNSCHINDLEKSIKILRSEKTVLIRLVEDLRTKKIQLVKELDIANKEKNATVVEMNIKQSLEKEILNLRQKLEQITKFPEMHENGADGQIQRLNQDLMSIRSKHNELIQNVDIAEKEKASVAEANKFLLEANKNLSDQLQKLKEEHTELISKSEMLNSVLSTIIEKNKSLVEQKLKQTKEDAESRESKLSQELTLLRLEHSQLMQKFEHVEKGGNVCVELNGQSSARKSISTEISILQKTLEQSKKDVEMCQMRETTTNHLLTSMTREIASNRAMLARASEIDQTCFVCQRQTPHTRRICSPACYVCWRGVYSLPQRF